MRVLSIEIGTDVTHVLEMENQVKNPKIYTFFSFATPAGMVGDGIVKNNEEFRKILQKGMATKNVKARKAIFSVTSGKIANREIEIPYVKDNRIKDLLNANSSEYFPVDLSQYQLVYRTVSLPELEKEKKRKLFVLAVPNDLVRSYEELSACCGLELVSLEYTGNAIFQTMRRAVPESLSLSVKIDEDSAMITIINKGELEIQRTIFYGVSEAQSLIEESGLFADHEYKFARKIMEHECLLNCRLDESSADTDQRMAKLKDEVTEALRPLIGNIARVIDYYLSGNAGVELKYCTLIGNAARILGLAELLTNELSMEVFALTVERSGISALPKNIEIDKYITCYGATLAPLPFLFGEKQSEEVLEAKKKKEMIAARTFCLICAAVCIGMTGYAFLAHLILKSNVNSLSREKESLSYIEDIYSAYEVAQTQYTDVVAMGDATATTSDQLADVIENLEQSLPESVVVSALTSDGTGMTLDMTVSSKPEAAKVIEELQNFEEFQLVKTDGITESTDDAGVKSVSLKVTCLYVNPEADTEIPTESTAQEGGSDEQ